MRIVLRIFSILLLVNLSFGTVYGGWILISDSGGGKTRWTTEILVGTPFKNFLIPGIILVFFDAVIPLIIVYY